MAYFEGFLALLIISSSVFQRVDSHRFSEAPGNAATLHRKMPPCSKNLDTIYEKIQTETQAKDAAKVT